MSNPSENLQLSCLDFQTWPFFIFHLAGYVVFGSLQSTHCSYPSPYTINVQEQPEEREEELNKLDHTHGFEAQCHDVCQGREMVLGGTIFS